MTKPSLFELAKPRPVPVIGHYRMIMVVLNINIFCPGEMQVLSSCAVTTETLVLTFPRELD